jgi:ABC-2 type transport system ATP-binding protein
VIDHGKIIADDTAANLKATLAGDRIAVTVDIADAEAAAAIMADRGREISRSDSPLGTHLDGRYEHGTRTLPGLLAAMQDAGLEVRAADVRVPTLDDVFLSLTGRSLREEAEAVAA